MLGVNVTECQAVVLIVTLVGMALHRFLLSSLLFAVALPAQDRVLVEARHAANWDDAAREGVCDIRVWVADEAEIEFRWDKYTMVATRGDEALDANTSCNRPLDTNGLGDFSNE